MCTSPKPRQPIQPSGQDGRHTHQPAILVSPGSCSPPAPPTDKHAPVAAPAMRCQMAEDVIAASEAQAQNARANGLAIADMLDHIEEHLGCMRERGLEEAQVLGEAIKKLVQDYIQGNLVPDEAHCT
uniref:Uncharacterized protein n=1 Tax=Coccidioides posadasii RMSCC 3488 TaxID=454284 RepID=A0A0J6FJP6_COCPO|nr:hypothetical protein CPAG_05392 [Coccidioides posadasii RMSCC 3488]